MITFKRFIESLEQFYGALNNSHDWHIVADYVEEHGNYEAANVAHCIARILAGGDIVDEIESIRTTLLHFSRIDIVNRFHLLSAVRYYFPLLSQASKLVASYRNMSDKTPDEIGNLPLGIDYKVNSKANHNQAISHDRLLFHDLYKQLEIIGSVEELQLPDTLETKKFYLTFNYSQINMDRDNHFEIIAITDIYNMETGEQIGNGHLHLSFEISVSGLGGFVMYFNPLTLPNMYTRRLYRFHEVIMHEFSRILYAMVPLRSPN